MNRDAILGIILRARDEASAVLSGVRGHLNGLSSAMQNARGPSLLLAGGIGILAAGFGALALKGIGIASQMEQSKIAFTGMLGSAKQADAFIKQMWDFAAKTPFEFQGVQDAARRMLAYGFAAKNVIPMLTAVGDATAALGGGQVMIDRVTTALGQMQAKGKVSAEEMRQLAESGVPAWQFIAEKIGVSIPRAMKLAELGAISSGVGIAAITEGMEKRFGGMMAAQANTVAGLLSTLHDNAMMVLNSIGEAFIRTFDLKDKMRGAISALQDFTKILKEQGFEAAGVFTLSSILGVAPEVFEAAWERMGRATRAFGDAIASVTAPIGAFREQVGPAIQVLVGQNIDRVIIVIAGAIAAALVPALWAVVTAFGAWVLALSPFLIIGGAVALLIYEFHDSLGLLLPLLAGVAGGFAILQGIQLVGLVAGWITALSGLAASFIATATAEGVLAAVTAVLGGPFTLIVIGIMALIAVIVLLITHWDQVRAAAEAVGQAIQQFFVTAFDNVVTFLSELPGRVWQWLVQTFQQFVQFEGQLLAWVGAAIPFAIGFMVGFWFSLPGRIWGALVAVLGALATFGGNLLGWAAAAIPAFVGAVGAFLAALPGRVWQWLMATIANIAAFAALLPGRAQAAGQGFVNGLVEALSGLPGRMLGIGQDVVRGLWNGVQSLVGWLGDRAAGFAGSFLDGLKRGLGIGSPSVRAAVEVGRPVVRGAIMGMQQMAPQMRAALPDLLPTGGRLAGARAGAAMVPQLVTAGGGGTMIHVEVHGTVVTPRDLVEAIAEGINQRRRGLGGTP